MVSRRCGPSPNTALWIERGAWLVLLWAATAWRARGVFTNHFSADEALYASFARWIASLLDVGLRQQIVDKPPLLFYLQALSFGLFGHHEWAARWPNFCASLIQLPLLARLCHTLLPQRSEAWITTVLLALSPFAIAYSATAYTDPLMVTLILGSWWAWQTNRPKQAGLWAGFALLTKYSTLLLWPLLLFWPNTHRPRTFGRLLQGLALPCTILIIWWGTRFSPSTFAQTGDGLIFSQLRLANPQELWERAHFLSADLPYLFGIPLPFLILIPLFPLSRRESWPALLYTAFLLLVHLPTYSRYLLPLTLLLALPLGRFLRHYPIALFLFLLSYGWIKGHAPPLASHPASDDGAHIAALALQNAPYGTVLYDYGYSWQWRYHLFNTGVYVEWVPDPQTLLTNLAVFYDAHRYIALAQTAEGERYRQALLAAQYQLTPISPLAPPPNILLYHIVRPPLSAEP